ncbi:YgdI/YgdR family lipoprotein [Thermodesulfobacteriota bacterium]
MRKKLGILLMTFLLMVSVGCATHHAILMKDGRTIVSKEEPKFDKKTGFYEIKTEDGHKMRLNKDEVVEIKEK